MNYYVLEKMHLYEKIFKQSGVNNSYFIFCRLVRETLYHRDNPIIRCLQDDRINANGDGSLLLHFAVCLANTDISLGMIQKGIDINVQNYEGVSVLHRAVRYNKSQQVKLLLDHGADLSLKNVLGNTPLHHNLKAYLKVN